MSQLYAACREHGALTVKAVQVAAPIQQQIELIFQDQANAFMEGVSAEVDFTGDWKPE